MSVGLSAVWRDYRNRRRVLLIAVAVAPVAAAAGSSLAAGGHVSALHLLFALCATSLAAAVLWFAAFQCPYCTRPFHWTWLIANPLSRECLHCGFAKWRDPHAARNYAPTVNDR